MPGVSRLAFQTTKGFSLNHSNQSVISSLSLFYIYYLFPLNLFPYVKMLLNENRTRRKFPAGSDSDHANSHRRKCIRSSVTVIRGILTSLSVPAHDNASRICFQLLSSRLPRVCGRFEEVIQVMEHHVSGFPCPSVSIYFPRDIE